MMDVPPPQEMNRPSSEFNEVVNVPADNLTEIEYEVAVGVPVEAIPCLMDPCEKHALSDEDCIAECKSDAEEEIRTFATDDELLGYAEELKSVFDDGFQWSDLSTIARLSIEFMHQFIEMNEKERRDGVVSVIEHLIDITDTPYLPDFITDPIMKALVPPFVDLMISVTEGEVMTRGAQRYGHNESVATPEAVNAFSEELKPVLHSDFTWSNFFQAFQESLEFFCTFFDMSLETKKDAIYGVLAFIIDETSWPFFLDPILDPILKAILPPVIDLVFDQIAG